MTNKAPCVKDRAISSRLSGKGKANGCEGRDQRVRTHRRNVLRAIIESGRTDIQVVAINDLGPVETNAHLLRFDPCTASSRMT